MSPITAWKEKFQVSNGCTLETALRTQLIDETKYQKWASKYYGLPIIEDEFFTNHPPSAKFIKSIESIASPSAVPCFEWKNILYVACLEPQKMDIHQKTIFFLASLKSMESLWNDVQSLKEQKAEKPRQKQTSAHPQTPSNPVKIDNDDMEFEYINWLKSIMFSVVDIAKAFVKFMASDKNPFFKNNTRKNPINTRRKTSSMKIEVDSQSRRSSAKKTVEITGQRRENDEADLSREAQFAEQEQEKEEELSRETDEMERKEDENSEGGSEMIQMPALAEAPEDPSTIQREKEKQTEQKTELIALVDDGPPQPPPSSKEAETPVENSEKTDPPEEKAETPAENSEKTDPPEEKKRKRT